MTQKRFTVQVTDHVTGRTEPIDLMGYALLGVVEERTDGAFAGTLAFGEIDVLQMARLFDMLVDQQPEVLDAFNWLQGVKKERKVFGGESEEARAAALRHFHKKHPDLPGEGDPLLDAIRDHLGRHDLDDPADTRFRVVDGGKTTNKEDTR